MRCWLILFILMTGSLSGCMHEGETTQVMCTDEDSPEDCGAGELIVDKAVDECPTPAENQSGRGVGEGQQILLIDDCARGLNGTWSDFSLSSHLDESWNGTPENASNGSDSPWIMIQFMSPDCSHCWNAADDMSIFHENYSEQVTFLTMAVNFSSSDAFNATREEVAAFQDKSSYFGCYYETKDCQDRPGDPHDWLYIDDRDQYWMYSFQASGTPSFWIIQPDGIVAWNQYQHNGDEGEDSEGITAALERFFGPLES